MTKPKGRFYKRRQGGQPTHGGWAIIHRKEFVEAHPEIVNYGKDFYIAKLEELSRGGRKPTVSEILLLDRLHAMIISVSLIDSYLARSGVLRADMLKATPPVLAPAPIVDTWLSLNRAIQSGLQALGMEPKAATADVEIEAVLASYSRPDSPEEGEGSREGEEPSVKTGSSPFYAVNEEGAGEGQGGEDPEASGGLESGDDSSTKGDE